MEQHQVHSHAKEKHFKHYLFEFIMLFLAVFLGFVAENIREGVIEGHKEKEYIISMINDLKTDTSKLGKNVLEFKQISLEQDSLKNTYRLLLAGFNQTFYRNLNSLTSYPDFIYTDGTIQQLKNSGGLRLIKNSKVVDSIMAYDAQVKKALINEAILGVLANKMDEYRTEMFNQQGYDEAIASGKIGIDMQNEKMVFLLSRDETILTKYYNKMRSYRWLSKILRENMDELKGAATRLIAFLQKEYHLE
jgi:hypothetical protein